MCSVVNEGGELVLVSGPVRYVALPLNAIAPVICDTLVTQTKFCLVSHSHYVLALCCAL